MGMGGDRDLAGMSVEGRDFVYVSGVMLTPAALSQRFDIMRDEAFDQDIRQVPVKRESLYALHPDRLTESERYGLDHEAYDLQTPTSDPRIRNQFQYYTYLLSGIGHNISKLLAKKRVVQRMYNDVECQYQERYAHALGEVGRKGMGASGDERAAWMQLRYPALCEVRRMCSAFLDELNVEYARLDVQQQVASRCITGMENDARMRGEWAWGNAQDKALRYAAPGE